MNWIRNLKYDSPILYWMLLTTATFTLLLAILFYMPDTTITRATGLIALQEKAIAFKNAIYWETRAITNPDGLATPTTSYGYVDGIDFDKQVFLSTPGEKGYVRTKFKLADVQVNNLNKAASYITTLRKNDARIDRYGDAVVIWLNNKPLNIELIESGLAVPDPSPPTNIVDRAFAAYYWSQLRGKKQQGANQ